MHLESVSCGIQRLKIPNDCSATLYLPWITYLNSQGNTHLSHVEKVTALVGKVNLSHYIRFVYMQV